MRTIVTVSGRRKSLPDDYHIDTARIVGLDPETRIVVDDFDARNATSFATGTPYMFGLTLCCNASDKGVEGGIVCRGCYGMAGELVAHDLVDDAGSHIADIGRYLYRAADGSFPGLDPISHIEED